MELDYFGVLVFVVASWVLAPVAARLQLAWTEMLGAARGLSPVERTQRIRGITRILRAIGLIGALAAVITLLLER